MGLDRRQFLLFAALVACVGGARAAAPLRFGVVPYLTARRLATLYEPVRGFFERTLARPVQFSSAPDYAVHLERLRKREYDLVADSPLFARLAQREIGYLPLARTLTPLQAILVATKDSVLRTPEELRHRAVAVSDPLAALTMIGLRFLRDRGLSPGKDIAVHAAGSHVNAIQRVLSGDAEAAIISRTTLQQIEPALAARIRIVLDLPQALSAVVYSAAPVLAAQATDIRRRLIEFSANDAAGKTFIESLGHRGLVAVGRELEQMEPLVVEYYRQTSRPD